MEVFNFVASCKKFNNGNVDTNGKEPLLLKPIAGTSPRGLNVISGTSAELQDFKPGKTYVVSATEGDMYEKEDGTSIRSFNFDNVAEVNPLEALRYAKEDALKVVIQAATKVEATEEVTTSV